jgi:hypothetical protein
MADAHTDAVNSSRPRRAYPVSLILSTIGVLTLVALATIGLQMVGVLSFSLLDWFDTDEAPIRVRNGSIDLLLITKSQEWEPVGGSPNWRIDGGKRFTDNYEVTVAVKAGATCGGSYTGTGSDVVFTYSNGEKIRLQSTGRHTFVKPDNANTTLTRDPNNKQLLQYAPAGYLQTLAVGNGANPTTMCTFTAANQLDHILVLNVP